MIYWTAPYSATFNIPYPRFQGMTDIYIQWNTNRDLCMPLLNSVMSNDLEWLSEIFNDTKCCIAVCLRVAEVLVKMKVDRRAARLWVCLLTSSLMTCTCTCRQLLCPSLIQIVANPVVDKTLSARCTVNDDVGRGSGCSAAPPNIAGCSAKAIYGWVSGSRFCSSVDHSRDTDTEVLLFVTVLSCQVNSCNCLHDETFTIDGP